MSNALKLLLKSNPETLMRVFGMAYAAWFTVGLFSIAFEWSSYFYHIEDLLFIAFAAMTVFFNACGRLSGTIALKLLLWVGIFSGLVEYAGVVYGFPFGSYGYTEHFGPRLYGKLPLAIPFAWWVIVFILHAFWGSFIRNKTINSVWIPVIVGLNATFVDLAIEPVATIVRSYWIWDSNASLFYGVPLSNFLSWFLVAGIISFGIELIAGKQIATAYRPKEAFRIPFAVLGGVLISFLVGAIVAGLWLAVAIIIANCCALVLMYQSRETNE